MATTAFLTDSSLCIGCKACEVACKEWNDVPGDGFAWTGFSYDHTGTLGHSTWRHVKFVENDRHSWEFLSDVCKHCERAGCLDACPTGSIVRTEFGGVFIQPDVCNGCGYCIVACPFGVVDRRPDDGRAFKCTFCYDRQKAGLVPACAKACPTESILFGEIDELRARGERRVRELRERGVEGAELYDARDTSVGGTHAMFIVQQDPRAMNLPPRPEAPAAHLRTGWSSAAVAAAFVLVTTAVSFLRDNRRGRRGRGETQA
ncbi:MAG TPA: 4Fe-4S dicluster domain-containing protein [Vicinamibacterales bacterium]|nr:4Fe-4S dicluster domain-containing protein [Vicinamibacterales bacterium]